MALNLSKCRRILPAVLLFGIVGFAAVALSPTFARAQGLEDDTAFDSSDLVLAVFVGNDRLSAGVFAVQQDGRFYLPAQQLAELFGFNSEVDLGQRSISGWALDPERTFDLNASEATLAYRDKRVPLPDNAVLDATIADDDLYVLLEVLNEIWPMKLEINLSSLVLRVAPDGSLPFQSAFERQQRRDILLGRKESDDLLPPGQYYPFVATPYQAFTKPALDLEARLGLNSRTDEYNTTFALTGVQDLAYMSADYSVVTGTIGTDFREPENIRLRFRREAAYPGALPWGLQDTQFGDVALANRDLIDTTLRGRGATFTTAPANLSNEFDQITVDGVSTPGYEVELYINNELIDFTTVNDTGIYQFNDVRVSFGNNRIRVVLYGPQGQIEERVENYFFNANRVLPGKWRFAGGVVDSQNSLIPINERDSAQPDGLAANLYAARGFSRNLTGFVTGTTVRDEEANSQDELSRQYLSAGAIALLPGVLVQAEAYQELGGGQAFDVRSAGDFKGFKINLRTSLYNDFESPDTQVGQQAKTLQVEGNVRKTFATFLGSLGLEVGGTHLKRESGVSNSTIRTRQSLGRRGTRITNLTRSNLVDGDHNLTSGNLSSTTRFRQWRLRNNLTYDLYPDVEINAVSADLRYGNTNDFSTGFTASQSFVTDETRLGFQVVRDFERFLGSAEANWSTEFGFGFQLRASTSFGPYGPDNDYIMQSDRLARATPVSAYVFRDVNYDGVFNEGDEPVADTKLNVGRRTTRIETNEDGYIYQDTLGSFGGLTNVSLDSRSIDDPYLVPSQEGYSVYPRPGVKQHVVFPLIDTGAIDGTLSWANDSSPIGGLTLQLMNADGEIVQETTTAADGYFTFEKVPPGSYTIRAAPESGLNIPFTPIEISNENLFLFGTDIEVVDLNRPVESDLLVGVGKDGQLNAEDILSLAKGFKTVGRGVPAEPVSSAPRAQPAVQTTPATTPPAVVPPPQAQPQPQQLMGTITADRNAAQPIQPSARNILDKISAKLNRPDTPVAISGVTITPMADKTRLVLILSDPVEYSFNFDPASQTLFLEMPYATWQAAPSWQGTADSLITGYVSEATGKTGTTLILNLAENARLGATGTVPAAQAGQDQLILDIIPN
jgi:hypothetical protein